MSDHDTQHTASHTADAHAAADTPMVVTTTASKANVVHVQWAPASYKNCDGYVIGIITGATRLTNFQVLDPKATDDQVQFTCEPDGVYSVVVEPIIRGRPRDALSSAPVGIPYP
ncbi:hypothetical protein [Stenotrophomonas sp. GZD-301]|uniref:hypothetical protein n=1 Tax=Stenotrophomonas sp. GZD-301 TaxID=3404814 RepID=UPI003BB4E3AC